MKSPKNKLFSTFADSNLSEKSMESIQGGIRSNGGTEDDQMTNYWNTPDQTDSNTGSVADHMKTDAGLDTPQGS